MGNHQSWSSPEFEGNDNRHGDNNPRVRTTAHRHPRENYVFGNEGYNHMMGRDGSNYDSPQNIPENVLIHEGDEHEQPCDTPINQHTYVYNHNHRQLGDHRNRIFYQDEDRDSFISSESEVDIPIYDDSSPITILDLNFNQNMNRRKIPTWIQTPPIEEAPVYTGSTAGSQDLSEEDSNSGYHERIRNKTPNKYFTYIDMDDQIEWVSHQSEQGHAPDKSPTNVDGNSTITSSDDTETLVGSSIISSVSIQSNLRKHSIPPLAFQRLRNCLLSLPLDDGQTITEKAIDRVASHVKLIDYVAKTDVLIKGEEATGIFIIINGKVNVVSENGSDVLATLHEGEYFGEISVLFRCPCTARVQTVTKCQFLLLEVEDARRLLHKVNVDIIDYFVYKRYLPTSDHMDVTRTQRRMVLTCLKMLPIFEQWSQAAIKALILQIKPALVILYQANTIIVQEKDPPVALYVIIRGRAVIKREDKVIVEMHADKHPVVIGEECLHIECNSCVTIQTSTCCQVILIKEEYIHNVLSEFAADASDLWSERQRRWKTMANKTDPLHQRFPHLLQFEVLYHLVINHRIFAQCSPRCVQYMVLQGAPSHFNLGQVVCTQKEYDKFKVVLVIKGTVELLTSLDFRYAVTIDTGDIFYRCDWMGDRGKLIARSNCLVLKIDNSDIIDALEQFNDSHLVLLSKPE